MMLRSLLISDGVRPVGQTEVDEPWTRGLAVFFGLGCLTVLVLYLYWFVRSYFVWQCYGEGPGPRELELVPRVAAVAFVAGVLFGTVATTFAAVVQAIARGVFLVLRISV